MGCSGFQQIEMVKDWKGQVTSDDLQTSAYNREEMVKNSHIMTRGDFNTVNHNTGHWSALFARSELIERNVMRVNLMLSDCETVTAVT